MVTLPVSKVGAVGIITDLPPQELPLNAWTAGQNVRFKDGAVEKMGGHVEVHATPTWAPYWLLPVAKDSSLFWLYASIDKVGATDGSTHADITRAVGGDYNTDLNIGWTGTVLSGMAVINNGVDVPQMWNPSLANKLSALTAWPATYVAGAMRSLKRYLVALSITKAGTRYPHLIKWSDSAPQGAVPASWDETDETLDAAEFELASEGGFLIDAVPLRDDLIIYKESQSWLMQYIGGVDIFKFNKRFDQIGMLSRKCAVEFFSGKHLVFTGEDVILHDGQQADSILAGRVRSSIFGTIDSTYYPRSFVAINWPNKEVWVCFPETGNSTCTKALVWNFREDKWGVRELPGAAFIASGIVNPISADETWDGAIGDWASDSAAWGDRSYDPSQRKMLLAAPGVTKLYLPDNTNQFDGSNMTAYVEKTAIGFPLKANDPPDYTTEKLVTGIWPRIRGTAGGIVNIYLGTQERVDSGVVWSNPFSFTIGSTEYADFAGEVMAAKLHAIRFESSSDIQWRLDGYDVELAAVGMHGNS